jgi:cysteinyl-tRNA synthetase
VTQQEKGSAQPPDAVLDALQDDINTPKALAEMFQLAKQLNKETDETARRSLALGLYAAGNLLGLMQQDAEDWFAGNRDGVLGAAEIEGLIEKRNQARASRDFGAADEIRERLASLGIAIEDSPDGTRWRRTG